MTITIDQAVILYRDLRIPAATFRRWSARGWITPTRRGRPNHYLLTDVDDAVHTHRLGAVSAA